MNYREYFTQHARWGKLIGAILGFIMAGPLGALLGIFIGNVFDRGLALHMSKPHWAYRTEPRAAVQQLFLRVTFSTLGHIAKADGRVSERAIEATQTLMREMELNEVKRAQAQAFFSEGKSSSYNMNPLLVELSRVAHDNPELIKLFVDIQYRVAQLDGLTTQKITLLNLILKQLGLAPLHNQSRFYEDFAQHFNYQQHAHQRGSYSSHQGPTRPTSAGLLAEAYALLGLTASATHVEVKRAYRRLMSKHHPDKMMAQGATDQAIKAANAKTQSIRKAYEQICAHRGW